MTEGPSISLGPSVSCTLFSCLLVLFERRAIRETRRGRRVLDAEGLLVGLTSDGENGHVVAGRCGSTTRTTEAAATAASTATATSAGRRIHADDAPDARRWIDVSRCRAATSTTAATAATNGRASN